MNIIMVRVSYHTYIPNYYVICYIMVRVILLIVKNEFVLLFLINRRVISLTSQMIYKGNIDLSPKFKRPEACSIICLRYAGTSIYRRIGNLGTRDVFKYLY